LLKGEASCPTFYFVLSEFQANYQKAVTNYGVAVKKSIIIEKYHKPPTTHLKNHRDLPPWPG
jgi:hypothetical protein